MSKISLLPKIIAPTGNELVIVADPADSNKTKTVGVGALASSAVAPAVALTIAARDTAVGAAQTSSETLIATTAAALALTGTPNVTPAPNARSFGQASADALVTQGWYDFPAGAFLLPSAGTDWAMMGWMAPGYGFASAQSEVYLSNGNDGAVGGNDRTFRLFEGGIVPGRYTVDVLMKNVGQLLLANSVPAMTGTAPFEFGVPIFWMLCQVGNRCYFAWDHVENGRPTALRSFTADTNHGSAQFYGAGGSTINGTAATRTANVVTFTRAAHGLAVGSPIWPTATGELAFVASVTANTFTVPSAGADGALSSTQYRMQAAAVAGTGDLWRRMGAAYLATNGDNRGFGGRLGGIRFLRGTAKSPGSLSALISAGAIDAAKFRLLADGDRADQHRQRGRRLQLPRSRRRGDRRALGAGGPVRTGTSYPADPVAQPAYLRADPRPRFPHSIDAGKYTGPIRLVVASNMAIRMLKATLYRDAALTSVVKEVPLAGVFDPADKGKCMVTIPDVLDDTDYFVKIESVDNPNVYCVTGPQDVGVVVAKVSQSTLNTWGNVNAVGGALAPVSAAQGSGFVLRGHPLDPLNDLGFARTQFLMIRAAGQHGDGDVAALNKMIALRYADPARAGRKAAVALVSLCISGHAKESYVYDRKRCKTSIGALVANTVKAGNWKPNLANLYAAGTPVYIKAGTARIYVGGRLCATSDASGNWIGQGITGSINQSTGAYTVTAAFAGAAEIEAEMEYRTGEANTAERASNGFTTWGDDASEAKTGRILMHIRELGRVGRATYTVDSWLNFMISHLSALTDADAASYMADINDRLYARARGVTVNADKSFAFNPLSRAQRLYMADPRSQSFSDASEQRARNIQRDYAASRGFVYLPGPLTYEVDIVGSPHAGGGAEGAMYGGEMLAHGVEWVAGTAGAIGEEVVPIAVTRIDANTVVITVSGSVENYAAALTTGAGGAAQGIFFGATEAGLARLDPAIWVPVLGGRKITVTKAGGIPTGYWNINYGSVVASAVTPLAVQTAILDNCLTLDQGGFTSAKRKGNPVQANPINIACV